MYLNCNAMKRMLTLVLTLFFASGLFAREAPFFRQIAGRVTVSGSSKPLHYASVSLAGTNISNVTNAEGVFSLKIPLESYSDGIVTISHLGYAAVTLKATDFQDFMDTDKPLEISMVPITIKLDPSIIKARDPYELLKAALYKVKDNYPMEYTAMTAFYREIVKKGSGKYLALNEAIIDINKAPYDVIHSDRAGIYKGRGSQNYDATDTLFIKYQGGLHTLLEIDQVKDPFAMVRPDKMEEFYDFRMASTVMLLDKYFYVVEIAQKPYAEDILMRGRIYIDSETLAIGRTELNMNVEGRQDAVPMFILKSPQDVKFEVLGAEYVINYKESAGKWYYEYAKAELKFSTRRKRSLFKNYYIVMSELAVTDHKPGTVEIKNDARVRFKDMMSEKVTAFTDENFWENYNIIEPDQSIENIIKKIVKQLKKHNAD